MKLQLNKKYTPFLGIVVISIWSLIAFKLFGFLSNEEDSDPVVFQEKKTMTPEKKKSWKPHMHQRDPFGDIAKTAINRKPKIVEPIKHEQKKIVKPKLNALYNGFVKGSTDESKLAIIELNKNSHLLSLGDKIEGFELTYVDRDSIILNNNEFQYVIYTSF